MSIEIKKTKQEVLEGKATRELLAWRKKFYRLEKYGCYHYNPLETYHFNDKTNAYEFTDGHNGYYNFTMIELKIELAKRPYVMNKQEAKAHRKAMKKKGR